MFLGCIQSKDLVGLGFLVLLGLGCRQMLDKTNKKQDSPKQNRYSCIELQCIGLQVCYIIYHELFQCRRVGLFSMYYSSFSFSVDVLLLFASGVSQYLFSDFNLSGGCFGTDIIQNCTKWSNIGVHGLNF